MTKLDVNKIPAIEYDAGMLVEQRGESVICSLTAGIASIIGAIFFVENWLYYQILKLKEFIMLKVNDLPQLDFEAGAEGTARHAPVVWGQIVAGIVIGVIIAVND